MILSFFIFVYDFLFLFFFACFFEDREIGNEERKGEEIHRIRVRNQFRTTSRERIKGGWGVSFVKEAGDARSQAWSDLEEMISSRFSTESIEVERVEEGEGEAGRGDEGGEEEGKEGEGSEGEEGEVEGVDSVEVREYSNTNEDPSSTVRSGGELRGRPGESNVTEPVMGLSFPGVTLVYCKLDVRKLPSGAQSVRSGLLVRVE